MGLNTSRKMIEGEHIDNAVDIDMNDIDTNNPSTRIELYSKYLHEQSKKNQQEQKDDLDLYKENMLILKQMFKKLDPTVLKNAAATSNGEVELNLKYFRNEGILLVKVVRARDLNAKDLRGKICNSYVQLFLYPSEVDDGVMQTQVVSNTKSPEYHELFTLPIHQEQLTRSRLVLQVYDQDAMGKDDFIGEALIPMANFDFSTDTVHSAWFALQGETDLRIHGNLEVSIKFNMPKTLLVTIHSANGLTNRYESSAPNPFVKMSIPGTPCACRTKLKRNTVNPVFNETFEFEVAREELSSRHIVFHCIDYDKKRNDSLGQIIIDLVNVDMDSGYMGQFELADLKNSDRLRSQLFQHATMQEFREALIAHAAFRTPGMIFKKHAGSKAVTLYSKKAGAVAKLRVIEGIPVY